MDRRPLQTKTISDTEISILSDLRMPKHALTRAEWKESTCYEFSTLGLYASTAQSMTPVENIFSLAPVTLVVDPMASSSVPRETHCNTASDDSSTKDPSKVLPFFPQYMFESAEQSEPTSRSLFSGQKHSSPHLSARVSLNMKSLVEHEGFLGRFEFQGLPIQSSFSTAPVGPFMIVTSRYRRYVAGEKRQASPTLQRRDLRRGTKMAPFSRNALPQLPPPSALLPNESSSPTLPPRRTDIFVGNDHSA